jgi:CRP-like cAMP-binding protein
MMDASDSILRKYLENLQLQQNVIDEVLACFVVSHYAKKDYFSFTGETNDKLGFVVDGLFCMYIVNEEGTVFTKDFIDNQRFLLATFDPVTENLATIQALKNSVIMEARYSDIQCLFDKYPDFELLARKRTEREVESIYEKLETFALLEAKERYRLFKQKYGNIESEIPLYLIASYLGITPTQLSRIRSKKEST